MGGYSSSQAKEMAYNSLDSTFEHELMWQFTEWSAVEEKTRVNFRVATGKKSPVVLCTCPLLHILAGLWRAKTMVVRPQKDNMTLLSSSLYLTNSRQVITDAR